MSEIWKPIVGFEGFYEISSLGNVRRIKPESNASVGRLLSQHPIKRYMVVNLHRNDGAGHSKAVHVLMCEAFYGPRPPGHEACHDNDRSTDNRLENLAWKTKARNTADLIRNGGHSGERNGRAKLTQTLVETLRERARTTALRQVDLAREFGINQTQVSSILRGESW